MLRPDIEELLQYARKKHINSVINSNGILATKKRIQQLKKVGLNELIISLDSHDPIEHDRMRNYKGCFEKAIKALDEAKNLGLKTQCWTYISKSSLKTLLEFAEFAEKSRHTFFAYFVVLSGRYYDDASECLNFEEREYARKIVNPLKNFNLEFPKETTLCTGGGLYNICIMPSGDMTFCPPVPFSYGHIKDTKIVDGLKKIRADHKKFMEKGCTGQCIINFDDYRKNCKAKFIYK